MGEASGLQLAGAFCFGVLIGWYAYYLNRYRTDAIQLSDLAAMIGAVGGGAVLALFPASTDLFGAYGVGLVTGFFGYLLVLVVLVARSDAFDWDFFLDGRRLRADPDTHEHGDSGPQRPMGENGQRDRIPESTSTTSTGIRG
jgi:hypothetical protein